jgi:hypothetical protein
MRAPRGRASKIVNGVTEYRPPLLIHNLGVFRQTVYAALENSRGPQQFCAPRSHRPARSRAADPNPSV